MGMGNNLQKWFSDSKIIDSNGDPLIMYHGSSNIFNTNEFKNKKNYHFFTSDIYEAERYTYTDSGSNKNWRDYVKEFYIKAERPFSPQGMNTEEENSIKKLLHTNSDYLNSKFNTDEYYFDKESYDENVEDGGVDNGFLYHFLTTSCDNYVLLEDDIIQKWIKSKNYDSFYTIESGWGINIAVYNSNQIKSTNNTKFTNSNNFNENIKNWREFNRL